MSVLFSQTLMRNYVQQSNYAGNTSTPRVQSYKEIGGNGVYSRAQWKSLPKLQRSAPTPYLKYWSYEDRGNFNFAHTESGPSQFFYNYQNGPSASSQFPAQAVIQGIKEDAEMKAVSKLLNEMKGEGANIANMIGERKQVVKSVETLLNTIVYTIRDLKRKDIRSAIRRMGGDPLTARKLRTQDIANQWLSLQYGWKPLLGDVYDIVNAAHHREKVMCRVFRCSSRSFGRFPSQNSWTVDPAGKQMGIRSTAAICKYMIRAFPNGALAEPAALGVTNPLTVLWEVTPWSFVVDWFLPVGNYLEQLTADHGWDFYDGCVSYLTRAGEGVEWRHLNNYTSAGWDYTNVRTQSWASTSYVEMQRTVLNGFPSARIPRFKNPLSVGHLANALALGYQLTGKSVPSAAPIFKGRIF
jgi:hypothetical protein